VDEGWFLESIAADESRRVHPVARLPFRVGRDPGNDLVVDARGLSRLHAVIEADAGGPLRVTDLGSTNGTFVNRERWRRTTSSTLATPSSGSAWRRAPASPAGRSTTAAR
jgi:pSer/pThr/pTyr-binding forkhead associated (FHA) protein